MSVPSADEAGRWCRSAAARLPADADVEAVRAALAGGPVAGRLWVEDVPAAASSPVGAARLGRELRRPVDPAAGPATRSVILRYAGGLRDLVVVSRYAPGQAPARAPAPDWGLGGGAGAEVAVAVPL